MDRDLALALIDVLEDIKADLDANKCEGQISIHLLFLLF